MLSGIGAFAGGLADGMRVGQDMKLRQQYIDEQKKTNARDAELHQAEMDEINLYRQKRGRLKAANDEIAAGWAGGTVARPAPNIARGLSDISRKTPIVAYPRVPGLASIDKRASPPAMPSDEMIGTRMLTSNRLEDPDELTRMASIYRKHGILEEMAPWMNSAYDAKKRGIPDALNLLLTGDGKGAAEVLRKGGIKLLDDPVRNNPDDPLSNSWRFRFDDGREKDINVRTIARKFFPAHYFGAKE